VKGNEASDVGGWGVAGAIGEALVDVDASRIRSKIICVAGIRGVKHGEVGFPIA